MHILLIRPIIGAIERSIVSNYLGKVIIYLEVVNENWQNHFIKDLISLMA